MVTEVSYSPGDLVDRRYRIDSLIGSGSFGDVYLAFDNKLNRSVALKLLHEMRIGDPGLIRRFVREATILGGLRHPNIVAVHRFSRLENGTPFLEMDYVPGESLRSLLKRESTLSCGEAVGIARQICLGLKHAHDVGVIHRDLKPENILLSKEEGIEPRVVIVDFGLSKQLDNSSRSASETLTCTGELLGTPNYMSPEQCQNKDIGWQSDLYSLGCVLFEMIAGLPPFYADNTPAVIFRQMASPTPKLKDIPGSRGLPDLIDSIIQSCTAKNQNDRYESYEELLEDLDNPLLSNCPVRISFNSKSAAPKGAPKLIRCQSFFIIGVSVIALLVLVGLFTRESIILGNEYYVVSESSRLLEEGNYKEAEELVQKVYDRPDRCSTSYRDFNFDLMENFSNYDRVDFASKCATKALTEVIDQRQDDINSGRTSSFKTLEKLRKIALVLLKVKHSRGEWSLLHLAMSRRAMNPNDYVLASVRIPAVTKLKIEAIENKGALHGDEAEEVLDHWFSYMQECKFDDPSIDWPNLFDRLESLGDKYGLTQRNCQLHTMKSAFFLKEGNLRKAQLESQKALDYLKKVEDSGSRSNFIRLEREWTEIDRRIKEQR